MSPPAMNPTPYPDINAVLQLLLTSVRAVLDNYFIGLYLYGSLASGDFDPGHSDIDFLVVTSEELTKNLISDLETMHTSIYESGLDWATKLEGSYVPIDAMRKYNPTGPAVPMTNKDKFLVARQDIDWVINRHILYTSGVVITGPPLQSIIDPVRPEELQEAVLTLIRDRWTPWVHNPDLFLGMGYQPFVVLTMCRALYALEHGTIASKRHSAEWVIAKSDRKWAKLINQAMAWHDGDLPGDIEETRRFISDTIEQAKSFRR
jgi:predicted nucleotidyltransferase